MILKNCEKRNFKEKFEEMNYLYRVWTLRMITPIGRVAVLKSLILSKLIHLFILLPNPPEKIVKDIQAVCYKFVWSDKPDKISRATASKAVKDGGINIPDIKTYITSLKLTWFRKYKKSKHKWKSIVDEMIPCLKNINKYGPMYKDKINTRNKFWEDCLDAYRIYYNSYQPEKEEDVLSENIFNNEKLRIGGRVIWEPTWFNNGVYCIGHFINENGKLYTRDEFCIAYNINAKIMTYNGCISSISSFLKKSKTTLKDNSFPDVPLPLRQIYSIHKGAKLYYNQLITNENKPNCCAKWTVKFIQDINWKKIFELLHKTKEVKLKWLQMRIVHRIIGTNVVLKEMNERDTDRCTFCRNERESIEHLFWRCEISNKFWHDFQRLLNEKCVIASRMRVTEMLILFGCDGNIVTDKVFDEILLVAKSFLFNCKYHNQLPDVHSYIQYLRKHYDSIEYNAKVKDRYEGFQVDWMFYKVLIE